MGDFNIKAVLGLNTSEFETGLEGAKTSLGKFTKLMQAVGGAFVVGQMTSFIKSASDMAEKILNTADSLEVSTDFLQEWNRTADITGIGADKATLAIERLAIKIGEGGEAFRKYNIALADSKGMRSTEAILRDVAALINGTADGAERAALAVEFFGKNGQKLIPLLTQINSLESGFKLTRKELESLDQAGDALTRLGKDAQIGGAMILNAITNGMIAPLGEFYEMLVNPKVTEFGVSTGRMFDRAAYMAQKAKNLAKIDALAGLNPAQASSFVGTFTTAADRVRLEKESAAIATDEESFRQKQLSDESALAELKEKQAQLLKERFKFSAGSLEFAEKENEIEKNRLKIKERTATLEEKIAAAKQKQAAAGWAGMDAFGDLNQAKLNRSKFSLGDLADMGTRGTRGQFRSDIFAARKVQDLEWQAQSWRGFDESRSQDLFNQADELRKGIVSLNSAERAPFAALEKAANSTAEDLSVLLAAFETGGATVQVLNAK